MTETLRRGYPGMKVGVPRSTGCEKTRMCHCQVSGAERPVQLFNAISCRPLLPLAITCTTVRVEKALFAQLCENIATPYAQLLQGAEAPSISSDGYQWCHAVRQGHAGGARWPSARRIPFHQICQAPPLYWANRLHPICSRYGCDGLWLLPGVQSPLSDRRTVVHQCREVRIISALQLLHVHSL